MSRILIICDYITPPSYAPRIMSINKYLKEIGHDVVLEPGTVPVYKYSIEKIIDKIFGLNEKSFYKKLFYSYSCERFEIILCSTYYYFPIRTASKLSEKWNIPLILDIRDIVEQWGNSCYFTTPLPKLLGIEKYLARLYERYNIKVRNYIMNKADAVTTVSEWHKSYLQSLTQKPVFLIYNGYDEEELHFIPKSSRKFVISFVGRLLDLQLRQPQLLFEAIGLLLKDELVSKDDICLAFYSEPELESAVRELGKQYGVNDIICWEDYVPRSRLNEVMAESSILLALGASQQSGQQGILGTKVFEAIGVEKPFLLVPTDNGCLAELIRQTGIGMAAESIEDVQRFIMKHYNKWEQDGYTHLKIQSQAEFSRKREALQMEEILTSCVANLKR